MGVDIAAHNGTYVPGASSLTASAGSGGQLAIVVGGALSGFELHSTWQGAIGGLFGLGFSLRPCPPHSPGTATTFAANEFAASDGQPLI
jgi:hypothetical protein